MSREPELAVRKVGALSSAAFDATDFERLGRFFDKLPTPIDHALPFPYTLWLTYNPILGCKTFLRTTP